MFPWRKLSHWSLGLGLVALIAGGAWLVRDPRSQLLLQGMRAPAPVLRDGGGVFFVVEGSGYDAGFDGQTVIFGRTESGGYRLADGGSCNPCEMRTTNSGSLALLSQSQSAAVGEVCPTNALQPALGEAGLEGWMTPVLVSKIGPCVEHCTLCGEVCPTDALRRFTVKQKREDIKLGLAVVNQNTCIAYNGGRDCIVCAEVCSYSAVLFRDIHDDALGRKKRVPTVD